MEFTLLIIGFLSLGIIVGLLFRKKKIRGLSHTTMWLICFLLFMLGLEIGNNREALSQLDTLGLTALLLTVGSVTGSVILAWLLWQFMRKRSKNKEQKNSMDTKNEEK